MKHENKFHWSGHAILLLLIAGISWLYFTSECPPGMIAECDRIHCDDDACEPRTIIVRDSIPCPPIPVVTKPCDTAKFTYIPVKPPKCEPDTIKVPVPFPVPGPERIVYKTDTIKKLAYITKDTIVEVAPPSKNHLWFGVSSSVYCFNEDGGEWSNALLQANLDYQIKDRWMVGVGLAHINYNQRENLYSDVATTSTTFNKSAVTEAYSHSTFKYQSVPEGEPCVNTIETQYIDRLTTEYYDRTEQVPYYVNPLDNYYVTARVAFRIF